MNIYIDESGSINNKFPANKCFVIALVYVHDREKLHKAYKRFVSSNFKALQQVDTGKMFFNGKFRELKGSGLDYNLKNKFVDFFSQKHYFDLYYIKINNAKLNDVFSANKARTFNYTLKHALKYFILKGYIPTEDCHLQLDERNEKTEFKHFLEEYLNTELKLESDNGQTFHVTYFDSSSNKLIQIADVFSNIYYSELINGNYTQKMDDLKNKGILKKIYEFNG